MAQVDTVFAGSIPALYEQYLVPLIFRPYARDMARRLADLTSGDVLETAAGTGVVTRELDRTLPHGVRITATDLNPAMLDHAAKQLASDRVIWQAGDALTLPFPDTSFDAVVCQFGVMFFPDKQRGYREARRMLKPGGRFIFNIWDKIEDNEFADVVTAALAEVFPNDPPRFMARTPHGYHDKDAIVTALRGAGFADVTVDTVTRRSVAASPMDVAIGYCQGTPLRNEIEQRDAARLTEATEAAARKVRAHIGSRVVDGKIQALVVTAR